VNSSHLQQLHQSIHSLLGSHEACSCGRVHAVPIQQVLIDNGVIGQIPEVLDQLGLTGQCLLVADPITYEVVGEQVKHLLDQDGRTADTLILHPETGDQKVEPTEKATDEVVGQANGADYLIAVGSGTINDIVKLAATRLDVPYLVVGTAPSMTGYSSALAAMLRGPIKVALDAVPPVAIIADIDILKAAPPLMAAAGVSDLISRSLSSTDWKMSNILLDTYYCDGPVSVFTEADQYCREHAAEIKKRQPAAIAVLTAALILAGMSITMAQTSSPGSGGGHMISHYWDMTAPARGRQRGSHGCQVGVGDLICFTLYEKLLPHLSQIDTDHILAHRYSRDQTNRIIIEHFTPLIGSEGAAALVEESTIKILDEETLRRALGIIKQDPSAFWAQLDPLFTSPAEVKQLLGTAGAPLTIHQLGIAPDELTNAYYYARYIRGRYTVLDLAYDLGLLEDLRDEVLADSGVHG